MKPRLKEKYEKEVAPSLMSQFSYGNVMEVPRLEKIVVNACMREAVKDAKVLTAFQEELTNITGQKVVITRAKKAIANFSLRQGIPIGARVTLRRAHMWEFLDRLVNVALPRVRDFKGVNDKLDGQGNFSMGITEHSIFPEVDPNRVDKMRGFNITMSTSAKTDEEARALLEKLGVPFRKRGA